MNIDEIELKIKMLIKKMGALKIYQVKEMGNIFNEIKLLSAARNKLTQNKITNPNITKPPAVIDLDIVDKQVINQAVITPINKPIKRLIMYSEIPHQHIKMVVKKI